MVVAVTNILEVFTSVISAHEIVSIAETLVFLVCRQFVHLGTIFFTVAQPFARNADIGSRALVLVVRTDLAEEFICPIVAIVIAIAHMVFVDTGTVQASVFTRGTDPAVSFVTKVSAVVELITYIDSQDTPSVGTFELILVAPTSSFVTAIGTLLDIIAEPLVSDAVTRFTFELMRRAVSCVSISNPFLRSHISLARCSIEVGFRNLFRQFDDITVIVNHEPFVSWLDCCVMVQFLGRISSLSFEVEPSPRS